MFPEGTEPFLEHFNLTIHPGEKLAIVGNNGAGKTTLIKIICGLYRPTSGKLLINGLDTATLSPEEIYLWCTAVFQDFHLLAATLAENVSCMPEEKTDDRRVRSCLKQVGLAQKIESLPKGLHIQMTKELEQDGVLLSGGELQKRLAQEITTMIHSKEEYEKAVEASAILFGGSTSEALRKLDEETLLQVFEGVPQFRIARAELGLPFVDLCAEKAQVFPSKGECRKMVQGGGVSLNKEKVADAAREVTEADLIAGKYLLVQKGKKNYFLLIAE